MIFLCRRKYTVKIESLMYLIAIKPDMMLVVCLTSRYMEKSKEIYLQEAKRALRYWEGTINYGIHYKKERDDELLGFTNSDYTRDMKDRKIRMDMCF